MRTTSTRRSRREARVAEGAHLPTDHDRGFNLVDVAGRGYWTFVSYPPRNPFDAATVLETIRRAVRATHERSRGTEVVALFTLKIDAT